MKHACRHRSRGGMTLVELLVSVVILTVMVMLFSLVLKSSQTVVAASHATMRANAAAAAIADTIRKDIRRITQNGFLAIRQRADGSASLMFITAGVSPSLVGSDLGTGMVVSYGIENQMLWRHGWVLSDSGTSADVITHDPTEFFTRTSAQLGIFVRNNVPSTSIGPVSSPVELQEVQNVWQLLATNCSELSIMWTDSADDIGAGSDGRSPDGNIDWYGILPGYLGGSGHPGGYVEKGAVPPAPESPMIMTNYRAFWDREDQNNWPVAIKITFVLADPAMPEEFTGIDVEGKRTSQAGGVRYEVICPIAR